MGSTITYDITISGTHVSKRSFLFVSQTFSVTDGANILYNDHEKAVFSAEINISASYFFEEKNKIHILKRMQFCVIIQSDINIIFFLPRTRRHSFSKWIYNLFAAHVYVYSNLSKVSGNLSGSCWHILDLMLNRYVNCSIYRKYQNKINCEMWLKLLSPILSFLLPIYSQCIFGSFRKQK